MQTYDYIVVGAGSAGCVLANRLSADPSQQVLLLEAGGRDDSPLVTMPKGFAKLVAMPSHAWHFPVQQPRKPETESVEVWARGKVLGGSSSINGMIYIRGQREDYQHWGACAGSHWDWASMKEAFRAIEDHELGGDDYRGAGGPVHVSVGKHRYPVSEALIQAGEQMGLKRLEDFNRDQQEGVGYYAHTIKNGRRVSAAAAFLHPVMQRPNLHVLTGVQVDRVLFEGRRAAGVIARRNGETVQFACSGEVILSCGAILSPKILQLSGIGPGEQLRAAGIEVKVDAPDVGRRMREHLGFLMPFRLLGGAGLNRRYRGIGLVGSVLQYYLTRSGPMATGPFEVGAFVRTSSARSRPDAQLYFSAFTYPRSEDNFPVPEGVEDRSGVTAYGQLLHLTSEATLVVRSPAPDAALDIAPNWLSTGEDCRSAIDMVKYMRSYMRQPALRAHVGEELLPVTANGTDEQILDLFRQLSLCGIHAVGSCRMGRDPTSVVDERLRVRGVSGLRVADCSVMPGPVSGNTNGPAMALGWRAAELFIADRAAQ